MDVLPRPSRPTDFGVELQTADLSFRFAEIEYVLVFVEVLISIVDIGLRWRMHPYRVHIKSCGGHSPSCQAVDVRQDQNPGNWRVVRDNPNHE